MQFFLRASTFFITVIFFIFSFSSAHSETFSEFTGAPAKLVWLQDVAGGSDALAKGSDLTLWGLSSEGGGERQLIRERDSWYKPMITPDGASVIVSKRKQREIYLIDWQSGKSKKIANGVAVAVWKEPGESSFWNKKQTWVYAFIGPEAVAKRGSNQPLYRFPIDKPEKKELLLKGGWMHWSSVQLSRDGGTMSALYPWPDGGVFTLKEGHSPGRFERFGKGCWTSLSPDNSRYLWIFDGAHRNLQMFDTKSDRRWSIRIDGIPDNKGFEVYHPRWSNDARFITLTGPYEKGEGNNRIGGGGNQIEVYIGKFDPTATKIEKWIQVTGNNRPDYYPDLWVEGGREVDFTTADYTPSQKSVAVLKWPTNDNGLVFLWENGKAANQLPSTSPAGEYQVGLELRGDALYTQWFQLIADNGYGDTGVAGSRVVATVQKSGQLALEVTVLPQSTEGKILSLGKDISLSQQQNSLLLQLGNDEVSWPGVFSSGKSVTLALNLAGETAQLFVNGIPRENKKVSYELKELVGDDLLLGDDNWHGLLEGVAIYNHLLRDEQIKSDAAVMDERVNSREISPILKVRATLNETTEIPAADAIGAYRRALVVNTYLIDSVLAGQYDGDKIVVAEWVILDGKVIKNYPDTFLPEELTLQKFDDHPELEGERLMMDIFEPDLDTWYRLPSN